MSGKDSLSRGWRAAASMLACLLTLLMGRANPAGAQGFRYVDNDPMRQCGGNLPCHTTIQGAVDAASPGETIAVYPGEYMESVDLSRMEPDGPISIITADADGDPAFGTVTVGSGSLWRRFYTSSPFDGDVTIVGFNVYGYIGLDLEVEGAGSATRDVEVHHVIGVSSQGGSIHVKADGNVTIADCTSKGGYTYGILVWRAGGDVDIANCTATGNISGGIAVWNVQGDVIIRDCTVHDNQDMGIHVESVSGKVTISRCTAEFILMTGMFLKNLTGGLEVNGCVVRDSRLVSGIVIDESPGPTREVHGNIICENHPYGLEIDSRSPVTVNAEGNWWGCAAGPDDEECDSVYEGNGLVDFEPWIDTISADAGVNPVVAGQPMVVRLKFSDSTGSVFLGPGPGDPGGPPPFTVSTDNGSLNGEGSTIGASIEGSDGILAVTLVPEMTGTATLTVVGPCGLEEEITLQGPPPEEEEGFVPEPGSVLLLGSGLMGLAGYAALRLGSGQGPRLRKR